MKEHSPKQHAIFSLTCLLCFSIFNFTISESAEKAKETVKPRLTIITSVFDGDMFIREFLEDITAIDHFEDYQLLLLHPPSPGNEEPVIQEFLPRFDNIQYIKMAKDPGIYGVWNLGIKIAKADFVTNANLDDRRDPALVDEHLRYLEEHPDVDLVYGDYYITQTPNSPLVENTYSYVNAPDFAINTMNYCLPGPGPIWRKDVHERYGFFRPDFIAAGDLEMWNRMALGGAVLKKLPGYTVLFYQNPTGLSNNKSPLRTKQRAYENNFIRGAYQSMWQELSTDSPLLGINLSMHSNSEKFFKHLDQYYLNLSGNVRYYFIIHGNAFSNAKDNSTIKERLNSYPNLSYLVTSNSTAQNTDAKDNEIVPVDILFNAVPDLVPQQKGYDEAIIHTMKDTFPNLDGVLYDNVSQDPSYHIVGGPFIDREESYSLYPPGQTNEECKKTDTDEFVCETKNDAVDQIMQLPYINGTDDRVASIPESLSSFFKKQKISDPVDSGEVIPIVAVFMVKNEETAIVDTLKTYVEGDIKHFFIFDTGSTDNTLNVTSDYLESVDAVAYYAQEPFIDFAASRNRALILAHEMFPHASFLLMPDAEWYLHNGSELVDFCKQHANETTSSYAIRIVQSNNANDFYSPRLIRNNGLSRFEGVVHEVIMPPTGARIPPTVTIEYAPSYSGSQKTHKRHKRDRELLLAEHLKHPKNTRTVFYLAQTYDGLQDFEHAAEYYQKRMSMNSFFVEENYMATYRYARAIAALDNRIDQFSVFSATAANDIKKKHPEWSWNEALYWYLEAHNMWPHRAEPLYFIGQYYREKDQLNNAFLFLRRAAELPYPHNDQLFVEKYIYDFNRWDQLSQAASWINECTIGKPAMDYLAKNYLGSSAQIDESARRQIESNNQWYEANCAHAGNSSTQEGCGSCLQPGKHYPTPMADYAQFSEEDFVTAYNYARAIDAGRQRVQALRNTLPSQAEKLLDLHPNWTWKHSLAAYLEAHEMRPHRAEPLYYIGKYYRDNEQHYAALLFLRRATELSYPQNDNLSIEKNMYDFDRWDQLSQAAWWAGECALGKPAMDYLIKNHPNLLHVDKNRQFYEDKCEGKYEASTYWGCGEGGTCPIKNTDT